MSNLVVCLIQFNYRRYFKAIAIPRGKMKKTTSKSPTENFNIIKLKVFSKTRQFFVRCNRGLCIIIKNPLRRSEFHDTN